MRVEVLCVFVSLGLALADDDVVTCGSAIKLINAQNKVRLHSHDVKYGSGSGQQSVTGREESDDVNSHWMILGANKEQCSRGTPVKCGDTIRLLHITTKCLLHSHDFPGPLSRNHQEVSCFGKEGEGDTGDNWKVTCSSEFWTEDEEVKFKHVDTGKYLSVTDKKYSRPINGQSEIIGTSSPSYSAVWRVAEGILHSKTSN